MHRMTRENRGILKWKICGNPELIQVILTLLPYYYAGHGASPFGSSSNSSLRTTPDPASGVDAPSARYGPAPDSVWGSPAQVTPGGERERSPSGSSGGGGSGIMAANMQVKTKLSTTQLNPFTAKYFNHVLSAKYLNK